jgi:hypothetical protein
LVLVGTRPVAFRLRHAEIEAEDEAALNTFPKDYQSQLLRFLRTSLNDPKFRDASISEPALKPLSGAVSRYVVCVRFTNQSGADAHQPINDKLAIFFHGNVNQLIDADASLCGTVTYKPLVEPNSSLGHQGLRVGVRAVRSKKDARAAA